MTSTVSLKKFFVFGIENAEGKTFRGEKKAALATSVATDVVRYYNSIGFKKIIATNCNNSVFIKDSTDRLLSFVTETCYLEADGSKEYRTAYWAWKEVKRQAKLVAKKATVKSSVKVDTEATNTTIKGSVEVKSPQQKKTIYYAIRKGRTVGIFTDWGETFELVNGYSGAEFKKFSVLSDAEEYLKGSDDE